jgi:hypothetical protein
MDNDMPNIDLFLDSAESPPKLFPLPSMDATMRTQGGSVVRATVHGDELRLTIATIDGLATLVINAADGPLFADIVANALRQIGRNVRGSWDA